MATIDDGTGRDELDDELGRFALVPEWVLDSGAKPRALQLYAVLALHANYRSGESMPARRTLGKRCGCGVDSIDKALRELARLGLVDVEQRFAESGDQTTNRYRVRRVDPGRKNAAPGPQERGHPGRKNAAPNETGPNDTASPTAKPPAVAGQRRARHAQDVAFDALVAETAADVAVEGGRVAAALKKIRGAHERDRGSPLPGKLGEDDAGWLALAAEIRQRAQLYRQHPTFGETMLTPTSLAANWTRVTRQPPARRGFDPDTVLGRAVARAASPDVADPEAVAQLPDDDVVDGELLAEEDA